MSSVINKQIPKYKSRSHQANKIISLLGNFLNPSQLKSSQTLDIGCANGEITNLLSQSIDFILGGDLRLDSNFGLYNKKNINHTQFIVLDANRLPFSSSSFDIVVCAQVYEHMNNAQQLFTQIHRVLRPGGICFFSGPNKWAIVEDHYKLPLLSWLPRTVANYYIRFTRGISNYDISPKSYRELTQLLHSFKIFDCLPIMLETPSVYFPNKIPKIISTVVSKCSGFLGLISKSLVPNFNWILQKPENNLNDESNLLKF